MALLLLLQGDQSREVVRVLVECCLQEARYNPYYGHLAARLAAVSKSHKVCAGFEPRTSRAHINAPPFISSSRYHLLMLCPLAMVHCGNDALLRAGVCR
jgi:hypothetical protein